ncbi:hypothetical protein GCM10007332_01240 [Epilithonimonas arachidiradicis]|nr:hypothetical protein GCM10007332_01240 [Epilithonimonas arachidiradicis]
MSSLVSSGIQGIGESGARLEGMSMTNIGGMPMAMPEISNLITRNPGLFKAIMLTSGGLTGGLSSTIAGGKFIDGFRQGLVTSGLNHLAHTFSEEFESTARSRQEIRDVGLDPDAIAPNDCSSIDQLLQTKTLASLNGEAGSPNIVYDKSISYGTGAVTYSNIQGKSVSSIRINGNTEKSYYKLYGQIGHELIHAIDTVSGARLDIYNLFRSKGYSDAAARKNSGYWTESNAYQWNMKHTPSLLYNNFYEEYNNAYILSQFKF